MDELCNAEWIDGPESKDVYKGEIYFFHSAPGVEED